MTIVKFFSGKETRALAEKIALAYDNPLGAFTSQKFSDGEIHISYDESIRGCEVFLIQSTTPPADEGELSRGLETLPLSLLQTHPHF